MRKWLQVIKTASSDFLEDNVMSHAAALSFYTALSLPPLIVLLVWSLGTIDDEGDRFLRDEISRLIGSDGGRLVEAIVQSTDRKVSLNTVSGWLGLAALLFAASGVFTQLQLALNRVWAVKAKPGRGLVNWLRKRFLSLGLIGVLAFLVIVSLAASTLLGATGWREGPGLVMKALNVLVSIVVFTILFASVFKLLPDVTMGWRDVLGGGLVTALLFSAAKYLIGLYIARKGLASDYGAAGSAIVVLAWVYFNGAVVLAGAEITQAWLRASGRRLEPNHHAVRLVVEEVEPSEGEGAEEPRKPIRPDSERPTPG